MSTELNILNITKDVLIVVEPSLLFTSMSPLYFSYRTNPLNDGLNPIAAHKFLPLLLLLLFCWLLQPTCGFLASSVLRCWDHTQGSTTVSRTPLDEWSARRRHLYLTNKQHSQQTNIYALSGIRTRNPSRRAAADPRLRPLGHWDRQIFTTWDRYLF